MQRKAKFDAFNMEMMTVLHVVCSTVGGDLLSREPQTKILRSQAKHVSYSAGPYLARKMLTIYRRLVLKNFQKSVYRLAKKTFKNLLCRTNAHPRYASEVRCMAHPKKPIKAILYSLYYPLIIS